MIIIMIMIIIKKTGYLLTPNLLQAAGSSDSRLQSDLQSFCSKKEIK